MHKLIEEEMLQRLAFDQALQTRVSALEQEAANGRVTEVAAVREVVAILARKVIEDEVA